jgi:hypothetical protein
VAGTAAVAESVTGKVVVAVPPAAGPEAGINVIV